MNIIDEAIAAWDRKQDLEPAILRAMLRMNLSVGQRRTFLKLLRAEGVLPS